MKNKFSTTLLVVAVIFSTVQPAFATDFDNQNFNRQVRTELNDEIKEKIDFRKTKKGQPNHIKIYDPIVEGDEEDTPTDDSCSTENKPDLSVEQTIFTGIDYSDKNEILYNFDITIKNTSAPLSSQSVWIHAYKKINMTKTNNIDTYNNIDKQKALYTKKLTNQENKYLKLGCEETITISDVQVPISIMENNSDIIFLIDAFNVVEENDETGDNFSFTSNNILSYGVEHPFTSFELQNIETNEDNIKFDASL